MGKALIIKGANFYSSSIGTETIELMPDNTTISIATGSEKYGMEQTITLNNRLAAKDNILIRNGESINLNGLRGVDGQKNPLRVDYCAYSANERITANVITTGSKGVPENYYPFNKSGEGYVTITNDTGEDAYFGFCFSGLTKSEKIYRDDYALTYKLNQKSEEVDIEGYMPMSRDFSDDFNNSFSR